MIIKIGAIASFSSPGPARYSSPIKPDLAAPGQIIASAMGQTVHRHGREGRPGQRPHHEIGYHAIRAGDNPGEHTIVFGMLGETIELTVRATNRDCYALGALAAVKFLVGKPAGMYGMADVLGL